VTAVRHELAVPAAPAPLRDHLPMGDGRIAVTSRWIEVDGTPVVPVSAEIHYSRIPAGRWDEVLRRAREGGITHLATYAIWNHHEEVRGEPRFDGDLALGAFLRAARRAGLEIVLRIGPYAHAEARHGGLPDWLLAEDLVPRSDDPAYLAHAARWFAALARETAGIPLFAIQVENELYDRPEHLSELKRLARAAGLDAPLWTATGWGGANLPPDELLPTFAGYADAFWTSYDAGFDPASASNFYFSDERDEVGVGADTRDVALAPSNLDLTRYPYATCELGGGMVSAYHRRPVVAARDVAALALAKLGSGSVWQGYYMYADGRNPRRGLQESHASGGRNDFPEIAYDFGAPIAVDGSTRESWARLRLQHHLLRAFGADLARMPPVFPPDAPGVPDTATLRYSVRSDGASGFLFVLSRQPGATLPDHPDTEWAVALRDGVVRLPAVDVPAGSAFAWPLRLPVGEAVLEWATAQPVTLVPWNGAPLLVLAATPGIAARTAWRAPAAERALEVDGPGAWGEVRDGDRVLARVLVLEEADALALALDTTGGLRLEGPPGHALVLGPEGWRAVPEPAVEHAPVAVRAVRAAGPAPEPATGGPLGRASIPADWSGAAAAELAWEPGEGDLVIAWAGDVARAWSGDRLVSDALSAGREWRIPGPDLPADGRLRIEVLPAHPAAPVYRAAPVEPGVAVVRSAQLERRAG
jgi:beta-galactosidase